MTATLGTFRTAGLRRKRKIRKSLGFDEDAWYEWLENVGNPQYSISEWFLWKIIYQGIYRRILREDPRFCHFPNEKSTTWEIYRDIFLIFGRCGWANPRRGLATWWMMPMPSFWRTAGPADSWGAGIGE
jgi:hypothetical protein